MMCRIKWCLWWCYFHSFMNDIQFQVSILVLSPLHNSFLSYSRIWPIINIDPRWGGERREIAFSEAITSIESPGKAFSSLVERKADWPTDHDGRKDRMSKLALKWKKISISLPAPITHCVFSFSSMMMIHLIYRIYSILPGDQNPNMDACFQNNISKFAKTCSFLYPPLKIY